MNASRDLACRELVELVTAYLEEALPRAERQRFEQHLARCGGCRAYLEQMRLTIQTLNAEGQQPLDPATRARLLESFQTWRRD